MHLTKKSALPTAAKIRRCVPWALPLLLAGTTYAQTAAPASPTNSGSDNDEEVVVLSPFVVDSSQDKGYRATSTLAGSRINTQLKDVAQSITVLTKEFLSDIDAVDVNDVLAFTANTEGTRDFAQANVSLGNPGDDVAANRNGANRIRGLAAAEFTRDYFYTIGTYNGFDSYNLDQVTINRGPNSILAGLGSPAGIINFSPQYANLAKNSNEVTFRIGSWNDLRGTVNFNRVLKKDVLALRLAAVSSDKGFKQEPSYNKDNRIYLAAAWKPFTKTAVRASYEFQNVKANNPNTLTPGDGIQNWINRGKPIYNFKNTPGTPAGFSNLSNTAVLTYNQNGQLERSFNEAYVGSGPGVALFPPTPAGGVPQRMNDNRYFDLESVNLNPSLDQKREFTAFNLSIDQEILTNLHFNASMVHEQVDAEYLNLFRSGYSTYMVDVNALLPDGSVNPHAGETYMEFGGLDNKNADDNTNTVWRGTLTYQLDLNKYNKWLGRYNLTAFAEHRRTETRHWQYNAKDAANPNLEYIYYRYYLGGTAANGYKAQAVPRSPGIVTNVSPNIYFDAASNSFKTNTLDVFYALKSDTKFLRNLDSQAVVLQGYLWDDRIVPMIGIRRDKDETQSVNATNGSPAGAYGKPAQFSKTTKTYGGVVHPLKWLSLHYNHSENFIPNAGSVDLLNNPVSSPTGLTKEYGFSVSTPDDKLNLKVNWFELTAAGANADNLTFPLAQWTIPYMELTFMPDLVRQANANGANITYKPAIASNLITGDQKLAGAYTSSNVSKGLELELTYNVTKNWRLMASVGKQEAKQSDIAAPLTTFIEERLAYWKSIPAIWSGPYVAQNVGWGVGRTGEQQWNSDNNPAYLLYKSVDGRPSPQLAKWHASVVTNYSFDEGTLKGFSIGTGLRYIEKQIIGNPQILNAAGTPIALDLAHPYYNSDRIAVDVWAGYKLPIIRNRYKLSFQLNIRDLDQDGGFRPIAAAADGLHTTYRIVQPRSFYLTTKLEF